MPRKSNPQPVVKNCDNPNPISHRASTIVPWPLYRIAAIPSTEDLLQILGQLSLVAVAHATQQIAFQVRRTALQRGSAKGRTDDILQTLQPVGHTPGRSSERLVPTAL